MGRAELRTHSRQLNWYADRLINKGVDSQVVELEPGFRLGDAWG